MKCCKLDFVLIFKEFVSKVLHLYKMDCKTILWITDIKFQFTGFEIIWHISCAKKNEFFLKMIFSCYGILWPVVWNSMNSMEWAHDVTCLILIESWFPPSLYLFSVLMLLISTCWGKRIYYFFCANHVVLNIEAQQHSWISANNCAKLEYQAVWSIRYKLESSFGWRWYKSEIDSEIGR